MLSHKKFTTNNTLKRDLILKLPFVESFKEEEIDCMVRYSQFIHVKKGTILSNSLTGRNEILLIIKGRVRVILISDEGKEITIRALSENEMLFNFAEPMVFDDTQYLTEIDEDTDLLRIDLSDKIYENHYVEIMEFVIRQFKIYFDTLSNSMLHTLSTNLETRVARFLLKQSKRSKSDEIHFTHAQIASYLNSSREQVSRVLGQFADDHLIQLGYGRLIITDEEGLKKLSEN